MTGGNYQTNYSQRKGKASIEEELMDERPVLLAYTSPSSQIMEFHDPSCIHYADAPI